MLLGLASSFIRDFPFSGRSTTIHVPMSNHRRQSRKLAAIMFTDMVGYSGLAQRNETAALELLEEHREIIRGLIAKFGGEEINTVGDGFLLEFASALEASRCAIEIQRAFARRNEGSPPARRMHVRIGIHVGDIVKRKGDVLGDGVNVAARIQSVADTDGICVSQQVYDHIANKFDHRLVPIGARALKNIVQEMKLYKVVLDNAAPVSPDAGVQELSSYRQFVLQPLSQQLSRSTGRSLEDLHSRLCAAASETAYAESLAPDAGKASRLLVAMRADSTLITFLNSVRAELHLSPFDGVKAK